MSRGLICDQCGDVLPVNARGDSEMGEDAGWLHLSVGRVSYDLCTRACVSALLEDREFITMMQEHEETIAEIARIIRGAAGSTEDGDRTP